VSKRPLIYASGCIHTDSSCDYSVRFILEARKRPRRARKKGAVGVITSQRLKTRLALTTAMLAVIAGYGRRAYAQPCTGGAGTCLTTLYPDQLVRPK
jgi:hypothetical protein